MSNTKMLEPVLDDKTLAFLLRDKIYLNIYDLCTHIDNNFKSIDILVIKKNYVQLITDLDINKVIISYIKEVIDGLELDIDDNDYKNIVMNNIDVFFEINYDKKANKYIIEMANYN